VNIQKDSYHKDLGEELTNLRCRRCLGLITH
jgi:hypothetical protein